MYLQKSGFDALINNALMSCMYCMYGPSDVPAVTYLLLLKQTFHE